MYVCVGSGADAVVAGVSNAPANGTFLEVHGDLTACVVPGSDHACERHLLVIELLAAVVQVPPSEPRAAF
jgi:hypothetical protein